MIMTTEPSKIISVAKYVGDSEPVKFIMAVKRNSRPVGLMLSQKAYDDDPWGLIQTIWTESDNAH